MKETFRKSKIKGSIRIDLGERGVWEADKTELLREIVSICEEYDKGGYTLTLRQLYYQLVSKDAIPNHDKVYKKLSSLKDEVVYSGVVDWDIFEDRGRVPNIPYFEDSVKDALERTVDSFRLDRQANQPTHVEVWTEKDAISGILKRITRPFGITLVVNKGYSSSTAMYSAYERFVEKIERRTKVVILYFGDHDPSGLDMIRDIEDRIIYMLINGERLNDSATIIDTWWQRTYKDIYDVARMDGYEDVRNLMNDTYKEGTEELFERGKILLYLKEKDLFTVKQVGLTMEQINQYNPPPNPAKITDPRAKGYIDKFGQVSWEVDALKPAIMEDIVRNAISTTIDMDIYNDTLKFEAEEKDKIISMINSIK